MTASLHSLSVAGSEATTGGKGFQGKTIASLCCLDFGCRLEGCDRGGETQQMRELRGIRMERLELSDREVPKRML